MSSAWCNCSSASAHELVTNAVKHGSLGRNGGRLMVNWRVEGKDGAKRQLAFEWDEQGSNGELPKPSREGFGMELLTRMLSLRSGCTNEHRLRRDGNAFSDGIADAPCAAAATGEIGREVGASHR